MPRRFRWFSLAKGIACRGRWDPADQFFLDKSTEAGNEGRLDRTMLTLTGPTYSIMKKKLLNLGTILLLQLDEDGINTFIKVKRWGSVVSHYSILLLKVSATHKCYSFVKRVLKNEVTKIPLELICQCSLYNSL